MIDLVAKINLQRMPLGELKPHPQNPREHPKPGSPVWEVMKRSLQFDYFDPIVWNSRNGMLVGGHFRVKLLLSMDYTHADVSVVDYDEEVHKARMIAANRPLGEWEETILASLAGDIEAAGLDAALAGYDTKALCALLDPPEVDDDDDAAADLVTKADELQQKWKVQPGDLYQIGPHRLLCGDCASMDHWQTLLEGGQADMAWWDPPYNVAYDQQQRKRIKLTAEGKSSEHVKPETILNDDLPIEEYVELLKGWFSAGFAMLKPGGAVYIAHADSFGLETRAVAKDVGIYVAQCLIWVKQAWTMGRQDHQWQHEPILYGWKPGAGHYWQGGFSQATVIDETENLKKLGKGELITMINHLRNATETTVIREPRTLLSELHPTVKPTRLVARHIWNSTRRGETVLELFGGSGTTLVAAHQLGRRCVATEEAPKYCSVILERLTSLGLQATQINGPR